ncbi:MAG: cupin domain-containing protein, partial [Gaiellaceae bacterium]
EAQLAGTQRRLLSADDTDGSTTALYTFGDGWSGDLGGEKRPIEVFVLEGELQIAGDAATAGCYAHLAPGTTAYAASAPAGAHALIMIDAERADSSGSDVKIVDPSTQRWLSAELGESDIPPGICIKLLNEDAETGDWTWVAGIVPGWQEDRAEIHDTIEECLVIRGDVLLGGRGGLTAGSYFWRPPMVRHGPMFSHGGAYFFFRTKGGNLTVEYEDVPGWEKMVADYVAEGKFYAGATA